MGERLNWNSLLCIQRERSSTVSTDHRNEFDKDYDRIVYSSSVRRLQDKAQVFPLQENDFTRTRLTHSLEASALARSLGNAIGKWLIEKEQGFTYEQKEELSALLQVSALIHDLGNPPFGHYGEDIIRNWFDNWFNNGEFEKLNNKLDEKLRLTPEEKLDFINFEGNAQTLRIVTKLQLLNDKYGSNFTYGTLATIMKYPWSSEYESVKSGELKKFGYFASEKGIAGRIQSCTGLKDGVRHPATFLLEASDDIAYLCADIEDAVKKNIIPWEFEYNEIKKRLLEKDNDLYEYMFKRLDEQNESNQELHIPDINLASIQNFKIRAQGLMFKAVVESFKENYEKIMSGEFNHNGLLESSKAHELEKELKKLAGKYCFADKEVLTLELVGDTVVNGLLETFVSELVECKEKPKTKTRAGKLYEIISTNFKYVCSFDYDEDKEKDFTEIRLYDKLLLITDFISGMTDSYAVNLYKELLGVKLP